MKEEEGYGDNCSIEPTPLPNSINAAVFMVILDVLKRMIVLKKNKFLFIDEIVKETEFRILTLLEAVVLNRKTINFQLLIRLYLVLHLRKQL